MKLFLESCGRYLPRRKVMNKDFIYRVETSDAWIQRRTGIASRHLASEVVLNPYETPAPPESLSDMITAAAVSCLAEAEALRNRVGMIIVATTSPDRRMPALAPLLQKAAGLSHDLICFDLNAACTGFVYAMQVARGYLLEHPDRAALILGAERLSSLLDFDDRGTCILFGDGAAATLWTLGEGPAEIFLNGTESRASVLQASQTEPLKMEGREVFRFAVRTLPKLLRRLKASAGAAADLHFLHQANVRIIRAVAKELGEPIEKFPMNLQRYGNTSAASLPLLLADLWYAGEVDRDSFARGSYSFAGFGAGLSYGGLMTKGL